MRIGLLGGSFNPPHKGHLHISDLALKKLNLDQIWWLPTKQNPFKEKNTNYSQRYSKCVFLTKNHPKIYVKKYNDIYTERLIYRLKNKYKNTKFTWIMGADNFEYFHKFKNFSRLVKSVSFAAFPRDDHFKKIRKTKAFLQIKSNKKAKLEIFNTQKINISSTQIRNNQNV